MTSTVKKYKNEYNVSMRQNIFRKTPNSHDIVKNRQKIICPYGTYRKECRKKIISCHQSMNFCDIKIGSVCMLLEKRIKKRENKLLFVKVLSGNKIEKCHDMFILRKTDRICGHKYTTKNCNMCLKSIKCVVNCYKDNITDVSEDITIENMYTYYRNVEILHEVDSKLYRYYNQIKSIIKQHPLKTLIEK
jgi:hypothetical protein